MWPMWGKYVYFLFVSIVLSLSYSLSLPSRHIIINHVAFGRGTQTNDDNHLSFHSARKRSLSINLYVLYWILLFIFSSPVVCMESDCTIIGYTYFSFTVSKQKRHFVHSTLLPSQVTRISVNELRIWQDTGHVDSIRTTWRHLFTFRHTSMMFFLCFYALFSVSWLRLLKNSLNELKWKIDNSPGLVCQLRPPMNILLLRKKKREN